MRDSRGASMKTLVNNYNIKLHCIDNNIQKFDKYFIHLQDSRYIDSNLILGLKTNVIVSNISN